MAEGHGSPDIASPTDGRNSHRIPRSELTGQGSSRPVVKLSPLPAFGHQLHRFWLFSLRRVRVGSLVVVVGLGESLDGCGLLCHLPGPPPSHTTSA
jgi:hypothetical protein